MHLSSLWLPYTPLLCQTRNFAQGAITTTRRRSSVSYRVYASNETDESGRVYASNETDESGQPKKTPPEGDTRIHWDDPDEGWIGGGDSNSKSQFSDGMKFEEQDFLGENFAELINANTNSHYQFLGVPVEADLEEIKAAYRRLSKEYHPDTTTLPLKAASEKFMKLREVYNILCNEETRRFYDWTLAQEAASLQAEKMKVKFEDPYQKEVENWVSVPDTVDRLKAGENLALSDQAMTALTVDAAIIVFAICCIIYVIYFKEPY